jgi:hypothetical protein
MPQPTYTALATVTLTSSASSVTFSSIPATYRDLVVVVLALGSTTIEGRFRFNGDTGNNYNFVNMAGDGTNTSSANQANRASGVVSSLAKATTTARLQMSLSIQDYSATDKHKTVISRADAAGTGTEAFTNRWANTAAITSVQILTDTGNWASGSTFALYGVIA